MLLNNHWVKEEIKKTRKYLETHKNNKKIYQKLWYAAKAALRRKFIVINIYTKKEERSQINNITLYQELEKKNKLNVKLAEGRK